MRASASTTHIDPTIHPIHVDCLDCGPAQFPRTCLRVIALRVCPARRDVLLLPVPCVDLVDVDAVKDTAPCPPISCLPNSLADTWLPAPFIMSSMIELAHACVYPFAMHATCPLPLALL